MRNAELIWLGAGRIIESETPLWEKLCGRVGKFKVSCEK